VTDSTSPGRNITSLLRSWSNGDGSALDALMPLVHQELKRLARRHLRHERAAHTIQPTALVNEAYLRLVAENRISWQNRAQFFGVTAQLMRFVLVDYARRRAAIRRGGGNPLSGIRIQYQAGRRSLEDIILIDETLARLAKTDERKARIVEMRVFAGLTVEECAAVLGVSAITVMRDWRFARAWLQRELGS
jgi:RNA polymerase sigma factor (TIGR02999 family)